MRFAASLDMYRKVPSELMEGTKRGSLLSILAVTAMVTLFTMETRAFLAPKKTTDLVLDVNPEKKLRVNFNITMMDLPCEYAVIDIVSAMGTDQNITNHITKFQIDQDGVNKRFHARNKHQRDLIMYDETITETLEELHEDGEDAEELDAESFERVTKSHQFVFVDFYANWCSHCRDLAPTWEALGEVMEEAKKNAVHHKMQQQPHRDWTDEELEHANHVELPVFIGKVDCVHNEELCMQQQIMAYPTLRLFVEGKRYGSDYMGHRTVVAFTDYLATIEKEHMRVNGKLDKVDQLAREAHQERKGDQKHLQTLRRYMRREWNDADHPGCQMAGFLMLDRVPGNFHVQARSKHQDIDPTMTNVSHEVHHLSFGEPYIRRKIEMGQYDHVLPPGLLPKTTPMDGNVYVTENLHEAHHHYLRVVTTSWKEKWLTRRVYQILFDSQLTYLEESAVPEARFKYDLSPIAVSYSEKKRKWYDYVTSIMAIVGGTFTVVGMMESGIHAVTKKKRF